MTTLDDRLATQPSRPYQMLPPLDADQRFILRQSIEKCGVLEPVVFDEDGEILDGHHRVEIAEELGIEYPRRVISDLTDPEKWMYAVTVNVARRHLDHSSRTGLVAQMRLRGMSIREIAKATGASYGTVRNDLAQVSKTAHLPETVTGSDGKTYAASRPTPSPGPTGAALSPPADPGATPCACGRPRCRCDRRRTDDGAPETPAPVADAPAPSQEPDPGLAQRVWDVLDQHGNPPYGLTVGEIWLKLDGVHSSVIPAALAKLAEQGRAGVMGHAQGEQPLEMRARWLNNRAIPKTPEPVVTSTAHPGSGTGEAVAPREGGAAAEPSVEDRVAAALDQHVPDPGAPARAWRRELCARVKPVHDFALWFKTETAAEFADEHDVETVRQLARSFADMHQRLIEARTATVTPLRRIK